MIGVVLWVPVLIALWVGLVGLAKAGRGAAWWTMVSGMGLLSLGLVAGIAGVFLVMQAIEGMMGPGPGSAGSSPAEVAGYVTLAAALAIGTGMLLFGIGFALHGFQARRVRERIAELEMVVAAQNDQLSRSDGGPMA